MKVFVIGSEGFIGSNCVKHFLKAGAYQVSGMDLKKTSILDYQFYSTNRVIEEVIEEIKPDACIYAAGSLGVTNSVTSPFIDFELNTVLLYKLLNSLQLNSPACRFIHISSASVYGNPAILPSNENTEIKPISPYGWHKYLSEQIVLQFYQLYQLPGCSIRPFSVFGPPQKKLLLWDIYQKSKQNHNISLFGTGNESRDFLYIDDLIIGIELLINKAPLKGESYNLASGKETKIKTIAQNFAQLLNKQNNIVFSGDIKKGDPKNWQADISKISKLGFKATISLDDGLKKYIQWLIENE